MTAQMPELSADDPINFQAESGLLTAAGNAVYTDENTRVEADIIRFYRDESRLEAEGNVRVTRTGLRFLTKYLEYNIATKAFSSGYFRAGYPPVFIEGESFEGTLEQIDFKLVTLYFREPQNNSIKVDVDNGVWIPDQGIRGAGLELDLPFGASLPLPKLDYRFGAPTISADGEIGYRNNLGLYGRSQVLYPINERVGLGANFDLYSNRGFLIGPKVELDLSPDLAVADFGFSTGFIRDHNSDKRGTDLISRAIPRDRYFISVDTRVRSNDSKHQVSGQIMKLSDSEMLRDFRPDLYYDQFQPDNFISYTYQNDRFVLNLLSRFRTNNYHGLTERLPELNVNLLPGNLGLADIQYQLSASIARIRTWDAPEQRGALQFPTGPLDISDFVTFGSAGTQAMASSSFTERADLASHFFRPIQIAKGMTLTPMAAARWVHLNQDDSSVQVDNRWVGQLGIDWELRFSSTWNELNLEKWGIQKLRHLASVITQYRYTETSDDRLSSPSHQINRYHYTPEIPEIDAFHSRFPEYINENHVLRLGFKNTFQAKKLSGDVEDFASIMFYQDLLIDSDFDDEEVDALYLQATFSPSHWLDIHWKQKFESESFGTESTLFGVTIRSSDLWSSTFLAEYLEGSIDQYKLDVDYRISESMGVFASWQFDSRTETWTEQRYGVSKRMANSWVLEVYVGLDDNNLRESDFSIGLRVQWLTF